MGAFLFSGEGILDHQNYSFCALFLKLLLRHLRLLMLDQASPTSLARLNASIRASFLHPAVDPHSPSP